MTVFAPGSQVAHDKLPYICGNCNLRFATFPELTFHQDTFCTHLAPVDLLETPTDFSAAENARVKINPDPVLEGDNDSKKARKAT